MASTMRMAVSAFGVLPPHMGLAATKLVGIQDRCNLIYKNDTLSALLFLRLLLRLNCHTIKASWNNLGLLRVGLLILHGDNLLFVLWKSSFFKPFPKFRHKFTGSIDWKAIGNPFIFKGKTNFQFIN